MPLVPWSPPWASTGPADRLSSACASHTFHACLLLPARQDPAVPTETGLSHPQVQVGVEFEANTRLQDTTFSFGYHLTLPQANMVFKGEDDGTTLGAVVGWGADRGRGRSPLLLPTPFSKPGYLTWPASPAAGVVDSNWCVGAVLEKKMPPLPVTLALGAFLNHWRNRFHCGFGVTVG